MVKNTVPPLSLQHANKLKATISGVRMGGISGMRARITATELNGAKLYGAKVIRVDTPDNELNEKFPVCKVTLEFDCNIDVECADNKRGS